MWLVARDTAPPRVGGLTHALPLRPFLHSSARRSAILSRVKGNKHDRKDSPVVETPRAEYFFYIIRSITDLDIDPSQMLRDNVADA